MNLVPGYKQTDVQWFLKTYQPPMSGIRTVLNKRDPALLFVLLNDEYITGPEIVIETKGGEPKRYNLLCTICEMEWYEGLAVCMWFDMDISALDPTTQQTPIEIVKRNFVANPLCIGDAYAMALLIGCGNEFPEPSSNTSTLNRAGMTPLMYAVREDYCFGVRLLVEKYDADIFAKRKKDGKDVLMFAKGDAKTEVEELWIVKYLKAKRKSAMLLAIGMGGHQRLGRMSRLRDLDHEHLDDIMRTLALSS